MSASQARRIVAGSLTAACACVLGLAAPGTAGASASPGFAGHRAGAPAWPDSRASWKITLKLRGSDNPVFTAVTAVGPHRAWAFESRRVGSTTSKPSAWRLTGSRWKHASFPDLPGQEVRSATSTSGADVWALATNFTRSRILRWNGHRWALSASTVWAVGGTQVAHWNGHSWSRTSVASLLPPPGMLNTPALTGIYAQARTSVWAIGTAGAETFSGPMVLLHYNGKHWRRVAHFNDAVGSPGPMIPDGSGGLWIPITLRKIK